MCLGLEAAAEEAAVTSLRMAGSEGPLRCPTAQRELCTAGRPDILEEAWSSHDSTQGRGVPDLNTESLSGST